MARAMPAVQLQRDRVLVMVRMPLDALHPPMAKPDRLATMVMAMLQSLHVATGGRLEWRSIDLVVLQPEHFEALEYAVAQQWVEVSTVYQEVRLTAEGRRVLIR
jgi:hypothetical protein